MKNAYVLEHHLGDNGNVSEGMILGGITRKRFDELEKKGLVREATDEEVEAGYQPPFSESGADFAGGEGEGEGGEKSAPEHSNKAAQRPKTK